MICFDAACDLAINQFQLPIKNVLEGVKSSDFYCPGSIVSLDLDTKNPISATLPASLPGYFINSSAFATTDQNVRVVARYAKEQLLRSGWLLGEDSLRGQIALAEVLRRQRPHHIVCVSAPTSWTDMGNIAANLERNKLYGKIAPLECGAPAPLL